MAFYYIYRLFTDYHKNKRKNILKKNVFLLFTTPLVFQLNILKNYTLRTKYTFTSLNQTINDQSLTIIFLVIIVTLRYRHKIHIVKK
ncbi:hypothetical protein CLU81_0513 [Flavobacterium sp. 9]|nr:hypothetical protein CLU81_0513 [Flavobacterium sp. 9]